MNYLTYSEFINESITNKYSIKISHNKCRDEESHKNLSCIKFVNKYFEFIEYAIVLYKNPVTHKTYTLKYNPRNGKYYYRNKYNIFDIEYTGTINSNNLTFKSMYMNDEYIQGMAISGILSNTQGYMDSTFKNDILTVDVFDIDTHKTKVGNKYKWNKQTKEFDIYESVSNIKIYRNTSWKWLYELIKKKHIGSSKKFISFSFDEFSGGQDDFGKTRIIFNYDELKKQHIEEVIYDEDYMKDNPDICQYITGYTSPQDYYDDKGYENAEDTNNNRDLTCVEYIDDYIREEELLMKKLKFNDNLINSVEFHEKPSTELLNLLDKNNITYEIFKI